MKKLGFGLMRLPLLDNDDNDDKGSIDIDQVIPMVDLFMQRGFTYFDTAYPYHNGRSETTFREAVVKRYPRESFTVTDKMPIWDINSADDMERIFNEQLERCGVDYFDYYWLHALNKNYYEKVQQFDAFGFILKKKSEGKIRHIGFSFHDESSLLEKILTEHPEAEYVQLQINYIDMDNPTVEAATCYDICTRHGKPVIVMEPVKGGSLAKVPDKVEELFKNINPDMSIASWAVRFAASLPNVMMVLSGMSNLEQVDDNTSFMQDFVPLNDEEMAAIGSAAATIKESIAIPCTACHYCTDGCPMGICIPEYFAIYNSIKQFGKDQQWMNAITYYRNLSNTHGKASECLQCGQCEGHCPQQIPIIENLELVAQTFE